MAFYPDENYSVSAYDPLGGSGYSQDPRDYRTPKIADQQTIGYLKEADRVNNSPKKRIADIAQRAIDGEQLTIVEIQILGAFASGVLAFQNL